ncbi:MAG: hypothetical protein JJT82_10790 [Legionellaceae bacterium]|nr:hypothetical protein [Legionellaceae bacterium]
MAVVQQAESETELNETQWFSTYGIMTAKRIVDRYKLSFDDRDLLHALKLPHSFIHTLIKLPLRNILNDVIREQAYDYITYAQKLFVDYLLSGDTTRPEGSQGAYTREELEETRQQVVSLSKNFQTVEYQHFKLISESQRHVIQFTGSWQEQVKQALQSLTQREPIEGGERSLIRLVNGVLCYHNIDAKREEWRATLQTLIARDKSVVLSDLVLDAFVDLIQQQADTAQELVSGLAQYREQSDEMYHKICSYRREAKQLIVKTNELIRILPEYQTNPAQNNKNKEDLNFDARLGEREQDSAL